MKLTKLIVFLFYFSTIHVVYSLKWSEKLNDKEFLNNAISTVAICNSASSTFSTKDCDEAEYLIKVKALIEKYESPPPVGSKIKMSSNIKLLEDIPYAKVFEEYIVTRRPFKGIMQLTNYTWSDKSCGLSSLEGLKGSMHSMTRDYSLYDCPNYEDFLSHAVKIPEIVSNSYLPRLNEVFESTTDEGKVVHSAIQYHRQWPAFLILENGIPTTVQKCPTSMHQVVWGAGMKKYKIRLFPDIASHAFNPIIGNEDVPHLIIFEKNGFDFENINKDINTLPKYLEVDLNEKEFLFIPDNFLASFLLTDSGNNNNDNDNENEMKNEKESDKKKPALLRQCFVDASNFGRFQESLSLAAKISEVDHNILKTISAAGFDTKMSRVPAEIPLGNFHSYNSTNSQDTGNNNEVEIKSSRSRRGRASSSANFRDWQENNKWNLLISSLTIPKPLTPVVTTIGRQNLTISWDSNYLPHANDKTRFGFNITLCRYEDDSIIDSTSTVSGSCQVYEFVKGTKELVEQKRISTRDGSEFITFTVILTRLSTDSIYRLYSTMFYDTAASQPSLWSTSVKTYKNTKPSPITSLLAEIGNDMDSTPASVLLKFTKPHDDGGISLSGYHIYSRQVKDNRDVVRQSTTWQYCGAKNGTSNDIDSSLMNIVIENLLPGMTYDFKVTAFNTLGSSPLSITSNHITTLFNPKSNFNNNNNNNANKKYSVLYGRGHERGHKYFVNSDLDEIPIGLEVVSSELQHAREIGVSSVIVISEKEELIYLSSPSALVTENSGSTIKSSDSIIGWRCHWSPNHFIASGESVWADSPYAIGDLKNKEAFNGRIVWMLRGGDIGLVFKVQKAQDLGSIGIIIVDNGRCEKFDQKCIPGSDKSKGDGFAAHDNPVLWKNIRIPVLFLLLNDAITFAKHINLPDEHLISLRKGSVTDEL